MQRRQESPMTTEHTLCDTHVHHHVNVGDEWLCVVLEGGYGRNEGVQAQIIEVLPERLGEGFLEQLLVVNTSFFSLSL